MSRASAPERFGQVSTRAAVALRGFMAPPGLVESALTDAQQALLFAAQREVASFQPSDQAVRRLAAALDESDWPRLPPPSGPLYASVMQLRSPRDVAECWGLAGLESVAVGALHEALDLGQLDEVQRAARAAGAAACLRRLIGTCIGGRYRPRCAEPVTPAKLERAWTAYERAWCTFRPLFLVGVIDLPPEPTGMMHGPGSPGLRLVSTTSAA